MAVWTSVQPARFRRLGSIGRHAKDAQFPQTINAGLQRAAVRQPAQPACLQHRRGQRHTLWAAEMHTALGPVQAAAAKQVRHVGQLQSAGGERLDTILLQAQSA